MVVVREPYHLPVAMPRTAVQVDPAGPGVVLVTGRGRLDAVARPVADAVTGALATECDAVVCDLIGISDEISPGAGEALATAAAPLQHWPGSLLAFVCSSERLRAEVARRVPDNVLVTNDRTVVGEAIGARQRPSHLTRRLPPRPLSSSTARELVSVACAEWDCLAQRDTARIIAAELVTNAVVHARSAMSFTIARSGSWLRLSVRDGSRQVPRRQSPAVGQPTGRGLVLVSALAESWGVWGVLPLRAGGKVTWAVIAAQVTAPAAPTLLAP